MAISRDFETNSQKSCKNEVHTSRDSEICHTSYRYEKLGCRKSKTSHKLSKEVIPDEISPVCWTFSPPHVIRHRAEQLEMDETKKLQLVPSSLSFLGDPFDEVYTMLQPSIQGYEAQQALITFVDNIVKLKIHGSSVSSSGLSVRAFGSFTMDLFTAESDLDLAVSLGHTGNAFPRENKIQVLKKLVKGLYGLHGGGKIHAVQPTLRTIVPIVKFVDCRSGIECDISIENKEGVYKSELIHIFSSIDKRIQKLCYLMKAWAKAHNINSSKDGTLNSLSIILLVSFHLQTQATPILPPFFVFLEVGCGLPEVEKRVLIEEAERQKLKLMDSISIDDFPSDQDNKLGIQAQSHDGDYGINQDTIINPTVEQQCNGNPWKYKKEKPQQESRRRLARGPRSGGETVATKTMQNMFLVPAEDQSVGSTEY